MINYKLIYQDKSIRNIKTSLDPADYKGIKVKEGQVYDFNKNEVVDLDLVEFVEEDFQNELSKFTDQFI